MTVEGHDKDGKRNNVQFVLSLTTSGRVPVWSWLWDGAARSWRDSKCRL